MISPPDVETVAAAIDAIALPLDSRFIGDDEQTAAELAEDAEPLLELLLSRAGGG